MAVPSSSDDQGNNLEKVEECIHCLRTVPTRHILRVVIRECNFYVTIHLIQLNIVSGVVKSHNEKIVNFLKLNDEKRGFYPTQDDLTRTRAPGKSFEKISDLCIVRRLEKDQFQHFTSQRAVQEQDEKEEGKSGIIEKFIRRLAKSLGLETCILEDSIDHVITSCSEVLLEMDYSKLTRSSKKTEKEIEGIIINIFWQPTPSPKFVHWAPTSHRKSNFAPNFKWRVRSRSVPRDRSKDDGWFDAVDNGRVVPFHAKPNASLFTSPNTIRDILTKCIHAIEENMVNAFSWYLEKYFYHNFMYQPANNSYTHYRNYQKIKKISNPRVIVVRNNPLEFNTHFAYILSLNFYSHHNYVQNYMKDVELLCQPVIRIDEDIPLIIRSLNPITRMHIFHMIYKSTTYARPSYEQVFKTLIILRDAMFRLRLKEISMCKIGCCCDRLNFGEVLRMIEYVFLETNIKVRIGLNLMKCWHFRSRSSRNPRGNSSTENADLYLERIDTSLSRDAVSDEGEIRSADEE